MTAERRRPAGGPGAQSLLSILLSDSPSRRNVEDWPLDRRTAEFRLLAADVYWRDRIIRSTVGIENAAEAAEDFGDAMTGLEGLLALPDGTAQRHADAAWAEHEKSAGAYFLAMTDRLRWLVRSGASEAVLLAAAEAIDARFGSPLAPGDLAVCALHFGQDVAERRVLEWRAAIAGIIDAARSQDGRHRRAG